MLRRCHKDVKGPDLVLKIYKRTLTYEVCINGVRTKRTWTKEPASKLLGQKVPGQKELHHRTKSTSYLYLKQHVNFICISFNIFTHTLPLKLNTV